MCSILFKKKKVSSFVYMCLQCVHLSFVSNVNNSNRQKKSIQRPINQQYYMWCKNMPKRGRNHFVSANRIHFKANTRKKNNPRNPNEWKTKIHNFEIEPIIFLLFFFVLLYIFVYFWFVKCISSVIFVWIIYSLFCCRWNERAKKKCVMKYYCYSRAERMKKMNERLP